MVDTAHRLTDEKLEEMEKRLSAIYSRAEKEIQKTADEYFSKFAAQDEKKRKLLEQGKITEDEYKKWRKGKVMYGKRFTEMKEQCAKQLLNVNQTALAYVNGELPEVYAINYNALAGSVDGVGGYSFTLVDADTVRKLATTDTSLLPYKELDPAKDIPWNMKKINAETLQGVLQGESMDKIAKRLRNVQEMNKTQAIRSARTIVTGAENKGRQDSYSMAESDGIILQKEWLATNDGRTRHSHAMLDGAIVDQDKKFDNGLMYPGDPSGRPEEVYNCRCTLVAKVNGFKKVQVQKATEKAENQERIRRRREEYFARKQQTSEPDFENMTRAQLDKYVSENISAKFGDVSGVNTDFYRKTVKAVKRVETKYGKIDGLNIEFGGIKGNAYAEYDPKTKTLHLKKKGSLSQFADSIAKADEKTMRKYGIKYNAESSYEGTVFHELAHAIDHDGGWSLSKSLGATDDILIKSRSISFYARDRGMPNLPRATEATAENISSYFMGHTDKIDKDVLDIIEEYFKRKKK
jgi:SPP1 gp7 family putative phage head morphogenesis protein